MWNLDCNRNFVIERLELIVFHLERILGEIIEIKQVVNPITKEEIFILTICSNELTFDVGINKIDLLGEPQVGRRFKGNIWLQGYINFPEEFA